MAVLERLQGWAEQGGTLTVTAGITSVTKTQASYPGCTIQVYLTATTTLASIYSDAAGTVPAANPFTTGATGAFGFYIADGRYDLRLSGTGITAPFTLSDITVGSGDTADLPLLITLPYSGDGSLIVAKNVKLDGSANAVLTAAGDTGGCVGTVVSGGTNTVTVAVGGKVTMTSGGGALVAGRYAQISGSQPGCATTSGAGYPTSGQVLGRILVGGTSPVVDVFGTEVRGTPVSALYWSSDYTTFNAAIAAIGSTSGTLMMVTSLVATAVTVPATLQVVFAKGGNVSVTTGQTVTFAGAITAAAVQIFANATAGQGTVSFAANYRMRSYQPEWWGAVGDGSANCTAAFIAAYAAVFSAGGGTLELGFGTYLCSDAVNATSGGVIYPPINAWTNSTINSIPISTIGQGVPTWGDYKTSFTGTTLKFTTATTNGVTYPAGLSGGKAYVASVDPYYELATYVTMNVEKLRIATYDNPSIGGYNFMRNNRSSARDMEIDVNVPETSGSTTTCAQPTHEVIGAANARTPNNGQAVCDNVTVTGYKYGIFAGDHFRASNFVMAARCLYGFLFDDMTGHGNGSLYSYRNLHDILILSTLSGNTLMDFTLQIECDTTSGTWTQRTIGTTLDITDAGDVGQGQLRYWAGSPGGVNNFALTYSGCTKVDFRDMSVANETCIYSRASSLTGIVSGVATNVPWNSTVREAAKVIHSDSSNPEQITIQQYGWYDINFWGWMGLSGTGVDNGTGIRDVGLTLNGDLRGLLRIFPVNTTTTVLTGNLFSGLIGKGTIIRVYISHTAAADEQLTLASSAGGAYTPLLTITMRH